MTQIKYKTIDKLSQRFEDSDYNFYDVMTLNKNGSYNDNIDYFSYEYKHSVKYYSMHVDSCIRHYNVDKCRLCYDLITSFGKDKMMDGF